MMLNPITARGLYAIIDVDACGERAPLEIAAAVLEGGCAMLQLRAKHSRDDEVIALGRSLRTLCADVGVPFVLNDRAPIAHMLGADGVHLGQDDLSIEAARSVAPGVAVGLSTHTLEQARNAAERGADLIGFGPVFETASKEKPDPVVGLQALSVVVASVRIPVVAIGGIDLRNVEAVASTGVAMAACIGALCRAADPKAAARALHEALRARD
jgi:thiamine-phosphate pyrophosphorylase